MDSFLLPILLVLFASFFQGTFGLGMKYIKPLSWEAWWLVYGFVAMIAVPVTWALISVPDLWGSISNAPPQAVWIGMLFGFLWGVGGILFGLSVGYVGLSLTYGIVMGLAGSVGSLIPLVQIRDSASSPALPYVLFGVLLMLVGVALAAWAGVKRDREQASAHQTLGIKSGSEFRKGLL